MSTLIRLSTAIFALSMAACSLEAPSTTKDRVVPEYDSSACDLQNTYGEEALPSGQTRSELVTSPYFEKRFDRIDLDSVLRTNALATASYITQLTEGRLYKMIAVAVKGRKVCPMFSSLPEAPPQFAAVWTDAVSSVGGKGSLAGLYFDPCYKGEYCSDKVMTRPTIIIDESRDRWTLVHEMLHFDFDRERKRDPNVAGADTLLNQAIFARESLESALRSYRSNKDRAQLSLISNRASWLTKTFFRELLVRGPYEEIAVEGTMLEEFLAGRLRYVSVKSAYNAVWYMSLSLDNALQILREPLSEELKGNESISLSELHDFIRSEALRNGWTDLVQNVDSDIAFIRTLRDTARQKIDQQKAKLVRAYPDDIPEGWGNQRLQAAGLIMGETQERHVDESAGMTLWRRFRSR